jgi:hypothetical protein
MLEIDYHAANSRELLVKYVLRLLTMEEARQFEGHFASCDDCAANLSEVTRFCELLQHALQTPTRGDKPPAADASAAPAVTAGSTIKDIFNAPEQFEVGRLLQVFTDCFNGFQKLTGNIAARMDKKTDRHLIERAALEILLALPDKVSKI